MYTVQITLGLSGVFKLFGAAEVPFVHWVYRLSEPLLAPFQGISHAILLQETYLLDSSDIFALIAYSIAGYILIFLTSILESRE